MKNARNSLTTGPRRPKQNAVLVDSRPAIEEELAQLLRIKGIVEFPVETQSNTTTRIESRRCIVEEKRPLFWPPQRLALMSVEANHERGNKIEFPVENRQRPKCFDARDHALKPERAKHFTEHRHVFDIEAEGAMTQSVTNVQEITCSRAEIENALTASPIQLELLHPAQIDRHPSIQIEIFSPAPAWIVDRVAIVNRLELHRIDVPDDFFDIEVEKQASGQKHPTEMPSHARNETGVRQFFELV